MYTGDIYLQDEILAILARMERCEREHAQGCALYLYVPDALTGTQHEARLSLLVAAIYCVFRALFRRAALQHPMPAQRAFQIQKQWHFISQWIEFSSAITAPQCLHSVHSRHRSSAIPPPHDGFQRCQYMTVTYCSAETHACRSLFQTNA